MLDALEKLAVPAVISNYAGAFLCNHVFYIARHQVQHLGVPSQCGFIHFPPASAQNAAGGVPGLPLARMVDGIECCLNLLRGSWNP
jgi:pyroglutamyl-peptidase